MAWFIPLCTALLSLYQYTQANNEDNLIIIGPERKLLPEYDFIVIGGGSAGSVVANRLSEIEEWTVLLLEAGGDATEESDVPLMASNLQQTDLDWQYKIEPQNGSCLAMVERRCNWPRGKVLGGSSVLNYMLYVRGNKNDYDNWESLGNKGWGYEDVLPYFLKSEDNRNHELTNTSYHGTGGYLTVSDIPYRTPLEEAFIEAGIELGYQNRDTNGENQTGFMHAQGTTRDGRRWSTSKAFLKPVEQRANLYIFKASLVTKIHIDKITKRAFGVDFVSSSIKYYVKARKEVILSAGTINSAQLLLLSGIGLAKELAKHNIPMIKNLPVGENLQDHIGLGGQAFLVNKKVAIIKEKLKANATANLLDYKRYGKGPLTLLGGTEGLAFVKTKYANPSKDYPDIQFIFAAVSLNSEGSQKQGLTDQFYEAVFRPINNLDTWMVVPILLHPKSRGYIRLRSASPHDHPLIYPNYLSDERDVKVLVEGVKIAYQLSQTVAFQNYGSVFNPNIFPACRRTELYSDDFWECMIRQYTITISHPVGTAKMGPFYDPKAVVDPELRVYGIKGLRVIDGSIMPKIVSGNTNAPIIMIGEKGSDMIKKHWLNKNNKYVY